MPSIKELAWRAIVMNYKIMAHAKYVLNHISEINKGYALQTVSVYNLYQILPHAKNAKIIII